MNLLKKLMITMLAFSSFSALAATAPSSTTLKYSKQFDFSSLLSPKTEFLGFIQPGYQRLTIKFTSVSKDVSDPLVYQVQGTSAEKGNVCSFSGRITIQEIREFSKMHYGVDDEFKNSGMKAQGALMGAYEFKEDPSKKFCGVFSGKLTLYWFVDREGKLRYDDIESSYSDNYRNNQYEGTWNAYPSGKKKIANWGEYRIPNSGDLDIGAGEFGAHPKYRKQGW